MIVSRALSGIFSAIVALRNGMYDRGQLKSNELRGPVVSVGNLSVGGAGKTPFTIMLGDALKQRSIHFDILSRGYHRQTRGALIVDPSGSPREFGDEPLLIARELGVDVVVGASRYEAGSLAEKTWGPRLHLLDDGFQHRRLKRQFDIVLLGAEDFHDALLPAGRLRESPRALSRADAVVSDSEFPSGSVPAGVKTWTMHRSLRVNTTSKRPVVFCGVGKPKNFFAQVRALGMVPAAEISFGDHHRYTLSDVRRLERIAKAKNADGFITTAKDAINLEPLGLQPVMRHTEETIWRERSESRLHPLSIAKLKVTLDGLDEAIGIILRELRDRGKPL